MAEGLLNAGMKEKLQDVIKWGLILVIAGAVVGLLTHFSEFGILGIWITAIATAAIAVYSFMSYQLASSIKSRDEEFRQQIRDLYEAIVISNIVTERRELEGRIEAFKQHYRGRTPIFEQRG